MVVDGVPVTLTAATTFTKRQRRQLRSRCSRWAIPSWKTLQADPSVVLGEHAG